MHLNHRLTEKTSGIKGLPPFQEIGFILPIGAESFGNLATLDEYIERELGGVPRDQIEIRLEKGKYDCPVLVLHHKKPPTIS